MGYDSSKQKHSEFPPRGLINFFDNEIEGQDCSKVIAVEHDCLQMIDVKKKEIKKLKMKINQVKDSNAPLSQTAFESPRDWLLNVSLSKRGGNNFCTIIRDSQLRPFDYILEDEEEQDEDQD